MQVIFVRQLLSANAHKHTSTPAECSNWATKVIGNCVQWTSMCANPSFSKYVRQLSKYVGFGDWWLGPRRFV